MKLEELARGLDNKLFKTNLSRLIAVPVMKDPKNQKEGYSHGFMVRETSKGTIVGHTGTFLGFRSIAFANLQNGNSAVVYANSTDVGREYYLDRVFASVDGVTPPAASPSSPSEIIKDFSATLGIEGKYISAMGIIEVYWRENKLILLTGGTEYFPKIERISRRKVSLRLSEEGGYTAWNGEQVDFSHEYLKWPIYDAGRC